MKKLLIIPAILIVSAAMGQSKGLPEPKSCKIYKYYSIRLDKNYTERDFRLFIKYNLACQSALMNRNDSIINHMGKLLNQLKQK